MKLELTVNKVENIILALRGSSKNSFPTGWYKKRCEDIANELQAVLEFERAATETKLNEKRKKMTPAKILSNNSTIMCPSCTVENKEPVDAFKIVTTLCQYCGRFYTLNPKEMNEETERYKMEKKWKKKIENDIEEIINSLWEINTIFLATTDTLIESRLIPKCGEKLHINLEKRKKETEKERNKNGTNYQ